MSNQPSISLGETFRRQTERDLTEAIRRDVNAQSGYLSALRECHSAMTGAVKLKKLDAASAAKDRRPR